MDDFVFDPTNYQMKPPRSVPQTPPTEAKAFIPDLSDDELRKLAREQLSKALQHIDAVAQPEMTRKLCAELMDRLDGRPAQAMTVDTTIKGAVEHIHNVELSAELLKEQIQRILKKPYVVIEQSQLRTISGNNV